MFVSVLLFVCLFFFISEEFAILISILFVLSLGVSKYVYAVLL